MSTTTAALGPEALAGGLPARIAQAYAGVANRTTPACWLVCFLTLGFRALLLPWLPVPMPAVHDEFSYLLAADTFASGRLTNPPHPYWEHFESFHILQQPTYASKYQPLPGMVMAVGEKFFGSPWVGVWLSAGLMCAALCWMLQGWISPGLALAGALLAAMRLAVLGYWMNSFWGGAIAAIGGALVLGAVARIAFRGQFRHSMTMAAGLIVLMESRPYEGAVLGLLSGAVLTWWLWRKKRMAVGAILRRVVLPAVPLFTIAAAFQLYYDYRVTGSPLELPYVLHDRQYAVAPVLAWSAMRPEPVYRHAVMREYWAVWFVKQVKLAQANLMSLFLGKLSLIYDFLLGWYPLLIPPLIWPFVLKRDEERITLFFLAGCLAALAPINGFLPHYAAFLIGLVYLRFLQGIDRLQAWQVRGKPLGFALAVFLIAAIPCQFGRQMLDLFRTGAQAPVLAIERAGIVRKLQSHAGQHVVLVRYAPNHSVHDEWVYNGANIDAQPIVWAREMGPEKDKPFVEYFRGRNIWMLEPDASPPKLTALGSASPY